MRVRTPVEMSTLEREKFVRDVLASIQRIDDDRRGLTRVGVFCPAGVVRVVRVESVAYRKWCRNRRGLAPTTLVGVYDRTVTGAMLREDLDAWLATDLSHVPKAEDDE